MKRGLRTLTLLLFASAIFVVTFLFLRKTYYTETFFAHAVLIRITFHADYPTKRRIHDALTPVVEEVARAIDAYATNAELARVNERSDAGETNIPLSPALATVMREGFAYSEGTKGRFDITVFPLVALYGFGYDREYVPTDEEIRMAQRTVGYKNARVVGTNLHITRKGTRFDLGAIGKGYMLARIRAVLTREGVSSYLVDLGRNIMVQGEFRGRPWRIGVAHPRTEGAFLLILERTNGVIATSGDYQRFFERDGVRYHHILDAKTGHPARTCVAATVIADAPLAADALSTIAFLEGTNFFTNTSYDYESAYISVITEGEVRTYGHTNKKRE